MGGGLLLLLIALGCSSGPAEKPRSDPKCDDCEKMELPIPGSRRASVFAWRDRFPLEICDADTVWMLGTGVYIRTEDAANAWKLNYITRDGARAMRVAACEYYTQNAALAAYESAQKAVASSPLTLDHCEKGFVAPNREVACALANRYLFFFDRPSSVAVVQTFVRACLTEPRNGD
ncbi:MAG TPA: hypothetical protein VFF73_15310 [Planctomycetota bacterium]|nr:hypothetical protein [Planctomycetota bacterium]